MFKKIAYVLAIVASIPIWVIVIRDGYRMLSTATLDFHPISLWHLLALIAIVFLACLALGSLKDKD